MIYKNSIFNINEHHFILQKTCIEFAGKELTNQASIIDSTSSYPKTQITKMGQMGLMSVFIPEYDNGSGFDTKAYVMALKEISQACASCGVIMSVNNSLYCDPILKHGSKELKKIFLHPFTKGNKIGCFALSEPGNGSDAAAANTKATLLNNNYILNGTKAWVTNGYEANATIIFATTNKKLKHHGISAFLIPIPYKGLTLGKKENKLGIKGSSTCNIMLDNCTIPKTFLLGQEGDGFKIAMQTLDGGRIGIASQAIGIAQAAFNAAVKYSIERKAFNTTISKFQLIQQKIADMAVKIESAKLLTMQAASLKDANQKFIKEAAMAKLYASETSSFVTHQAMQIFGGNGYIKDFPMERYFRDARITEIYEGKL